MRNTLIKWSGSVLIVLLCAAAGVMAQVTVSGSGAQFLASVAGLVAPGPILLTDGAVGAPSLSFASDVDTGFYFSGGSLRFAHSGAQKWIVDNNGSQAWVTDDITSIGDSAVGVSKLYLRRLIQGSKSKSLTDAAAAVSVVRIAVATNGYIGGKMIWTANSTDATDRLTTSGEVTFAGADTAGTVTCGIGAPYGLVTAYRRGNTLLCTFTAVTSTTNCDIQVTCTDNLAGSQTMAIEWRLDMPTISVVNPL